MKFFYTLAVLAGVFLVPSITWGQPRAAIGQQIQYLIEGLPDNRQLEVTPIGKNATNPTTAHFPTGTYQVQYRWSFFNVAFAAWDKDSIGVREVFKVVSSPTGSRNEWELTANYSYLSGDSTEKTETYRNPAWNFMDTLKTVYKWQPGGWQVKSEVKSFKFPGGFTTINFGRSRRDTSHKVITYIDSLNRLTLRKTWSYNNNLGGLDTLPALDYYFFNGSELNPHSQKSYGIRTTVSNQRTYTLTYRRDSLLYDSFGREVYYIDSLFSYMGPLLTAGKLWVQYFNNGAQFTSRSSFPSLGYTRRSEFSDEDSTSTYYYIWNGRDFRLTKRNRTLHSHPNILPYLSEDVFEADSLLSSGWKTNYKNNSYFLTNPQGRIYRHYTENYYWDTGYFQPYLKFDLTYYSPELVGISPPWINLGLAWFPNPATSTIHLSTEATRLTFTNALGLTFSVMVKGQKADVGQLPKGIYHVTAFSNGKAIGTSRVVKE